MGCSWAGEATLQLVHVIYTQSCLGSKKDKGAREPRALTKEWVASGQGSEKRKVAGSVEEPRSSFVCLRLSNEVIGVRGESRKGREVGSGVRSGLC